MHAHHPIGIGKGYPALDRKAVVALCDLRSQRLVLRIRDRKERGSWREIWKSSNNKFHC